MSEDLIFTRDPFTAKKVVVPQHVVYRTFPTETVVLNLRTGKYHGLNPTAGAMLEGLAQTGSVAGASAAVARGHGLATETVEPDVRKLCTELLERGLVELAEAP